MHTTSGFLFLETVSFICLTKLSQLLSTALQHYHNLSISSPKQRTKIPMGFHQQSGTGGLKKQREAAPVKKNSRKQVGTSHVRDSIVED
jgi:hypothetical protein